MDISQLNLLAVYGAAVSTALAAIKVWETTEVFRSLRISTEHGSVLQDDEVTRFAAVTVYNPTPRTVTVISVGFCLVAPSLAKVELYPNNGDGSASFPQEVKAFGAVKFSLTLPIVRNHDTDSMIEFGVVGRVQIANRRALKSVVICKCLSHDPASGDPTLEYTSDVSHYERRRYLQMAKT